MGKITVRCADCGRVEPQDYAAAWTLQVRITDPCPHCGSRRVTVVVQRTQRAGIKAEGNLAGI